MTVSKIAEFMSSPGSEMALCSWFDKDDQAQEKLFDPRQLLVIEE